MLIKQALVTPPLLSSHLIDQGKAPFAPPLPVPALLSVPIATFMEPLLSLSLRRAHHHTISTNTCCPNSPALKFLRSAQPSARHYYSRSLNVSRPNQRYLFIPQPSRASRECPRLQIFTPTLLVFIPFETSSTILSLHRPNYNLEIDVQWRH